jgi:3-hydroxyacyl-[acyl-carrier-protein] dehydratase
MRLEYFEMIDRVIELALDEPRIVMSATVPKSSPVFEGHWPGYPLMPAVLLIEAMAQTSGLLILSRMRFARIPFLAAVRSAKVRRPVSPGDELLIEARLLHEGSGFTVAASRIKVGERQVCDAELTHRTMPFPDPKVRAFVEGVAAHVGLPSGVLSGAG